MISQAIAARSFAGTRFISTVAVSKVFFLFAIHGRSTFYDDKLPGYSDLTYNPV
jgi:hypothetical protein